MVNPTSVVESMASAIPFSDAIPVFMVNPTSVVESMASAIPSSDAIPVSMVNPTSVVESMASARCLVNPITGLSTVLTTQHQQYLAQATYDAFMLTGDVLAQRTLHQTLGSDRPPDAPLSFDSAIAKTKVTKSIREKQKKTVNGLTDSGCFG
jgi:hypothetical protein